jgi:short-subunit dehydrogenase
MDILKNKVVWVTGASSGIGRETAIQLNKIGSKLILSARNTGQLEGLKAELSRPEDVVIIPIDLGSGSDFQEEVETAFSAFGRVDILFNNAGISQRSYAHETTEETDRKIMEVNFFGTVALTKAVLPRMIAQGGGQFAVTSSVVGKFGYGVRSSYSASKHALHGFFESLHIEQKANGIDVSIICVGPTRTELSKHSLEGDGKPTGVMDEMQLEGMPVEECVRQLIKAMGQRKKEIVIGDFKVKLGVFLHSFAPNLFFKMALKQNPRGDAKF